MSAEPMSETPPPPAQVDITSNVDVVRVLVASPRDWGHGNTDARRNEAQWMEYLLNAIRKRWPWAVLMHDGCPTGGSAIIERYWAGTLGLPTEQYPPEWHTCAPSCPPGHRKPRANPDLVHGTAADFCPNADVRMARRVMDPRSTVRPHQVIGVCTEFSRVTRAVLAIGREAGLPVHVHQPRWHGDEFR